MYKVLDAGALRLPGTVAELAPLAVKYGFQGINCPTTILEDANQAKEALAALQHYGLQWGVLPTPFDIFTDVEDLPGEIEKLKRWAEAGEKLGVKHSYNHIWSSHNSRAFDENFEWHVKRLELVQEIFKNHGISYGLEFLGPHHLRSNKHLFVHTITGVLAIADAAGGYAGVLFDSYHWFCSGGRLDDLYFLATHPERFVAMHLNDAGKDIPVADLQDMERCMPMSTNVIDTVLLYNTLKKAGCKGPVLIEPMEPTWTLFSKLPVEDCIRQCGEVMNLFP